MILGGNCTESRQIMIRIQTESTQNLHRIKFIKSPQIFNQSSIESVSNSKQDSSDKIQ